jgi:hypothetical protein
MDKVTDMDIDMYMDILDGQGLFGVMSMSNLIFMLGGMDVNMDMDMDMDKDLNMEQVRT